MTETPAPDRTLDCTGLLCPLPIVKLAKAAKEMLPSQVVLLLATDPGAIADVAAWAKQTGNPLLAQDRNGAVMRFWIQKG